MSDCSKRAWEMPDIGELDERVLYAPDLTAYLSQVDAIDVRGTRFVRERECREVWNDEERQYELDCCGRDAWLALGSFTHCPNCGAKVRSAK